MGVSGLLLTSGLPHDLIISQISVRITKRLVTAGMEIPASLCMIVGTTSLAGRWKGSGMKQRVRKSNLALREAGEEVDEDDDDKDDDDSLPFACFICKQTFVDPVVTKCNHYFYEHCALKHHSKNKKCFVCNKPTLGIFNTAHEIRKRMAVEGN